MLFRSLSYHLISQPCWKIPIFLYFIHQNSQEFSHLNGLLESELKLNLIDKKWLSKRWGNSGPLLHCDVVYALWSEVFQMFGVQWVMPLTVIYLYLVGGIDLENVCQTFEI